MKVISVLFLACLAMFGEEINEVARITALEGSVKIFRASDKQTANAQILDKLFIGDSLKTDAEAEATILYANGKILLISNSASIEIESIPVDATRGPAGEEPSLSLRDTVVEAPAETSPLFAFISESEKSAIKIGVRGPEDTFFIYAPGNTSLTNGRPTITWGSYEGAQSYNLLFQKMGNVVMSIITVDTSLIYPETKEELKPGSYLLKISVLKDGDTLTKAERFIKILKPEDVEDINNSIEEIKTQKPDAFTLHFLSAKIYEEKGLRLDAIREYETLLQIKPDVPFVHQTLAILYNNYGLSKIGNQYLDRYEELTGKKK